jgi:hypothetical protein
MGMDKESSPPDPSPDNLDLDLDLDLDQEPSSQEKGRRSPGTPPTNPGVLRLKFREFPISALTEEAYQKIMAYVRVGCFAHVAAQAVGIPRSVYRRWLNRGRKHYYAGKNTRYAALYHELLSSHYTARASAEAKVWQTDPRWWLTHGPAKEDWHPEASITLSGGKPISIHHQHTGSFQEISQEEIQSSVAQALSILGEMGFLQLTDAGKQAFLSPPGSSTSHDQQDQNPPDHALPDGGLDRPE